MSARRADQDLRPVGELVGDAELDQAQATAGECAAQPSRDRLIDEMCNRLTADDTKSSTRMVRAAMAHLNFVMIHPFSDGNGRMSRCLQTLVLARGGILSPTFCSIEEYLGRNTQQYYAALAEVA